MWVEAERLKHFYKTNLGVLVQRKVIAGIEDIWPDVKGEVVVGPGWPTIFLSAGIFVLHHFFALHFLGFALTANLLACLGLFVGGATFSWLYVRYRSIWIPYITHAICDVVVFGIGWMLIFG